MLSRCLISYRVFLHLFGYPNGRSASKSKENNRAELGSRLDKNESIQIDRDMTNAVLRLECSIDCISGSVGHQQNISRSFSHCQRFL